VFRVVRILFTLLRSGLKKKIDPTKQLSIPLRVWPGEVDLRLVNQSIYFFYCELARWDIIYRSGLKRFMTENKCVPVVASQMIRITRPLKRYQKFEVSTHLCYWDEKWFYFDHAITSNGKLIAAVQVRGLFKKPDRNVSTHEILRSMGLDSTSPPISKRISSWVEAEDLLVLEKKPTPLHSLP